MKTYSVNMIRHCRNPTNGFYKMFIHVYVLTVFPSCDIYRTELFQCRKKCHSNLLHLENSTIALLKITLVYSCFKYMELSLFTLLALFLTG